MDMKLLIFTDMYMYILFKTIQFVCILADLLPTCICNGCWIRSLSPCTPLQHTLTHSLQAISNPNSEEHQEAAWQTVLPLVSQLRKFYEYAIELETALCQLLSVLCSPEMDALKHLEQQQVSIIVCMCLRGMTEKWEMGRKGIRDQEWEEGWGGEGREEEREGV